MIGTRLGHFLRDKIRLNKIRVTYLSLHPIVGQQHPNPAILTPHPSLNLTLSPSISPNLSSFLYPERVSTFANRIHPTPK